MDFNKIKLLINTVIHLRAIQIYYRFYYFLRNRLFGYNVKKRIINDFNPIVWKNRIDYDNSYFKKESSFTFLNISHSFSDKINWNFNQFGKLWTYNLNYFDFLNQENISKETGLRLIQDFIKNDALLKDGKEPYPISLRGVNWVKFLSTNQVKDELINNTLYFHYCILFKNLEYHLLGNHLLENAFSLLFGAYYFQDEELYNKSKNLLISELNEQVLKDGAHFELSPMYHKIMLFRVLDCIQLIKLNSWKNDDLLNLLEESSSKMLSWLYKITFNNGDIPMINDCAFQIAPSTKELLNYGKLLGINKKDRELSDSGYRMFKNNKYELFMDMGEVGASYQPGHVHSDTFNFVLYVNNQPFIVDTGTSTYEKNERRQLERSTSSHNTITIGDYEQTQIWGGFRVAKRAKIVSLKESSNLFSSSHNGYKNIGVIHNRKFITNKDSINIFDELNKQDVYEQIAHFHFHPSIKNIIIKDSRVYFKNSNIEISFNGKSISIEKEYYKYAHGFNKTENAIKLKVVFESNLETTIYT
ncbi:MAG: hypothetical protein ACI8ZX_000039 [Planctomycetota bacterium]|jgi:hypothetical protein